VPTRQNTSADNNTEKRTADLCIQFMRDSSVLGVRDCRRHDEALAAAGALPSPARSLQTSTQGTTSPGLDRTAPGQQRCRVPLESEIRADP
jgi:hypothetical protein